MHYGLIWYEKEEIKTQPSNPHFLRLQVLSYLEHFMLEQNSQVYRGFIALRKQS